MLVAVSGSPIDAADDVESGSGTGPTGTWFPANDFYPRYLADPLRPQNALTLQWLPDTEVPDTTGGRFGLRLGGSFGIYRWHSSARTDVGWQLSFEGGFAGQFDTGYSWDNTGWDGFYGLILAWKPTPRLGFRIGTQHNSSHVGDEYWNRDLENHAPIHYTREEGVVGVAWSVDPRWTVYSEIGYGNGSAGSVTLRVQAGAQYISDRRLWNERASWFSAFDIRSYQGSDWRARATAQAGFLVPVGNRAAVHRFAVEAGTGRSVMGQFKKYDETWLGVGWFYDF